MLSVKIRINALFWRASVWHFFSYLRGSWLLIMWNSAQVLFYFILYSKALCEQSIVYLLLCQHYMLDTLNARLHVKYNLTKNIAWCSSEKAIKQIYLKSVEIKVLLSKSALSRKYTFCRMSLLKHMILYYWIIIRALTCSHYYNIITSWLFRAFNYFKHCWVIKYI